MLFLCFAAVLSVGALSIGYGCVLLQRQSACTPLFPQRHAGGGGGGDSAGSLSSGGAFDRSVLQSVDWPAVDIVNPAGDIRRVDIMALTEQAVT